ncbi:MAG: PaaI family thioesterase [Candidatus Cloacimonetes bacterium]|nr:PaaI family thioesterase [Candidatus Cloacimonadota bacterium]
MEERYDNCFICGMNNPIGLKLTFTYPDNIAQAEFRLPVHFEGYDNIIHGGIVAAILDEAMAKIILHNNIKAVTVTITIDYKKPLKPDIDYIVKGSIINIRKKIIETEATIVDNVDVYAKATAKFFSIS